MATAGERSGRYLYRTYNADGSYTELAPRAESHSVAYRWSEAMLDAIRTDKARPTVHARNLYHVSAAMYDAWAAYDDHADQVFHQERQTSANPDVSRAEAISFAAYRMLAHRFALTPGAATTMAAMAVP